MAGRMVKAAVAWGGFTLLALAAASGAAARQPTAPEARALEAATAFGRLSEKLTGFKTLQADFRQEVTTEAFPVPRVEQGTLKVLNPGRMRWDYVKPEKKLAVSDGKTLWFWTPADKVAVRQAMPADAADLPTLLLAGKGRLDQVFDAVAEDSGDPSLITMRLTPKGERKAPWTALIVTVRRDNLDPVTVVVDEPGSVRTTYVFSNVAWNADLKADLFTFTPPKGTKIIQN